MNVTIEQKAQNMADGLGITVWIHNGQIFANKPSGEAIEVRPGESAKPTPHGADDDTKSTGDGI